MAPEQFVASLYQGLLGREPDRGGLSACVAHLQAGAEPSELVRFFVSSAEFRERVLGPGGPAAHEEPPGVSDPEPLRPSLRIGLPGSSGQQDVLVLQSADPYHYFDMLAETSRTVRRFCQTNGFRYQCVIGIKRGYFSWHAAFNRIIILKELIDSGYAGWVFYIDADAYIADQTFDLRAYLEEKSSYAAIFVHPRDTNVWYYINNGIFFINTATNEGRDLIQKWFETFMSVPESMLCAAVDWDDLPHDQDLLHRLLQENPAFRSSIFLESPHLLGWEPGFVRQLTRGEADSLSERKRIIKSRIDSLLGADEPVSQLREINELQAKIIVSALYKGLLGQKPSPEAYDRHTAALCVDGLQYGLHRVIETLVASAEFKARFASGSDVELNYGQGRSVANALYRSLFEREADRHALNSIPSILREQGLEIGLQNIVHEMMRVRRTVKNGE